MCAQQRKPKNGNKIDRGKLGGNLPDIRADRDRKPNKKSAVEQTKTSTQLNSTQYSIQDSITEPQILDILVRYKYTRNFGKFSSNLLLN